ncbi:hypothetical protein COT75_05135 [Candidatus Beckwithbacteria bacterium CG10_big_fil_rev_8_21_14_0_10_34_10]|uniref:Beta-lactamase class A catalytic domain-containing protein n=1 Tax=Candidatus Beckwithbacteria bacterium CG10_big_fil_rev_8_21_14_0_10_34_10 TaxID=1974495 RepID=A0A2H0W846_9BACT|nr:MAG: hypothetical protein COT75_05135 [Candidatus Beckwithbacteria bacterium CG10_big_fil_rev_8_21_14_0_10_34_10]
MAILKKNFKKEISLEKKKPSKIEVKGSRKAIVWLILISFLLSALFYLKTQKIDLYFLKPQPFIYKIGQKKQEEKLSQSLGIKVNLSNPTGLENSLNFLLKDLQGEYGFYYFNFNTKEELGINENQVFQAASVNKLPIMISFYQEVEKGNLKIDSLYVLDKEDFQDYGSGVLHTQEQGIRYSYEELVKLMGKHSDNTAAYVMARIVGYKKIRDYLDKYEMNNTTLDDNNTTTPKEMGNYLRLFYENELIGVENKEKILEFLTQTDFEDRLPQGVPSYIRVAHKTGNLAGVYNDCGFILSSKPYLVCVFSQDTLEQQALDVIPKIAEILWEYNKT